MGPAVGPLHHSPGPVWPGGLALSSGRRERLRCWQRAVPAHSQVGYLRKTFFISRAFYILQPQNLGYPLVLSVSERMQPFSVVSQQLQKLDSLSHTASPWALRGNSRPLHAQLDSSVFRLCPLPHCPSLLPSSPQASNWLYSSLIPLPGNSRGAGSW